MYLCYVLFSEKNGDKLGSEVYVESELYFDKKSK
jgi:hypothetical protein